MKATLAALALLAIGTVSPPVKACPSLDAVSIAALADALPPCPFEDSRDCFWDAATRGTGTGQSFIDVNGTAYPLPSPCELAAAAPTDANIEACTGEPVRLAD